VILAGAYGLFAYYPDLGDFISGSADGSVPDYFPMPLCVDGSWEGVFSLADSVGVRIAVTTYKYASLAGNDCIYKRFCGATTPTCGVEQITYKRPCASTYLILDYIAVRIGQKTHCFIAGPAFGSPIPATCQ
jgi:hypothetical protein